MTNSRSSILAAILCGLTVSATAQAQSPLSGDEVRDRIAGNTLMITTSNLKPASGFFESDGSVRGKVDQEEFTGSWEIKGDKLCFDLSINEYDICRTVVERGPNLDLFSEEGEPAGRIVIKDGNPDGF